MRATNLTPSRQLTWLLAAALVVWPCLAKAQAKGPASLPEPRVLDAAGTPQTFALQRAAQAQTLPDAASWATTARLHQDATGLHVNVTASDATPERIQAPFGPHNATAGGDSITLSVDAKGKGVAAHEFRVNAAGATADNLVSRVNGSVKPWTSAWTGRAKLTAFGWEVSYWIPWATLGLRARSTAPQRIAVNVVRRVGRGDLPVLMMVRSADGSSCYTCAQQALLLMPGAHGRPAAALLAAPTTGTAPAWVAAPKAAVPTAGGASANVAATVTPRRDLTTQTVAANTELTVSPGHAWRMGAAATQSTRSSRGAGPRGHQLQAQQTIAQDAWTHQMSLHAKRHDEGAAPGASPGTDQPASEIEAKHQLSHDVQRDTPRNTTSGADSAWVSGYGAALATQGRWKGGGQDLGRGVDVTGRVHLKQRHNITLGYGMGNVDGHASTARSRRATVSGKSRPLAPLTIQASLRTGTAAAAGETLTRRSHALSSDTALRINRHVTLGAQSIVERLEQSPGDFSKATALQASTSIGFDAHHQLRLAASTHQRHQSQTGAGTSFPRIERSTRGQWQYTYRPNRLASLVVGQRHTAQQSGLSEAALRATFDSNTDKVWFTQVVVTY